MSQESEDDQLIKITIKSTKSESKIIEISCNASVKQLREMVAAQFEAPQESCCLIFAGKILKDDDLLKVVSIRDGVAVHVVVKNLPKPAAAASSTTAAPTSTSTTPPSVAASSADRAGGGEARPAAGSGASSMPFPFLGGMGGFGASGVGFDEMQRRMQQQMMANPDMMRQLLDSPVMQSLLNSPDIMREMFMSNPQMQQIIERNPEVGHMLNNPEMMRMTMEMLRNPNVMQEMMRQQDRAMSNLESIPGGFGALQRLYEDIQEPMYNATTGARNPFAQLSSGGSSAGGSQAGGDSNRQRGVENLDPLPNPWGGGAPAAAAPPTGASTQPAAAAPSATSAPPPTLPAGGFASAPGMQSLFEQLSQNPDLMSQMLQSPGMQSMMQNPQMMQLMLQSHPMFAANPQLQEQMRTMMPEMMRQMSNPTVRQAMGNPRVIQAIAQMQQAMQTLQQEAPGLIIPGAPGGSAPPTGSGDAPAANAANPFSSLGAGAPGAGDMGTLMAGLSQMLRQPTAAVPPANLQPPEERFQSQLEQLAAMGFTNRQQNIRALLATQGDLNAAIDLILLGFWRIGSVK